MTFSGELIKIFEYIGEQLGIAIDWTAENMIPQAMEILGRYRIYEIITYSACIFIFLIPLFFSVKSFIKVMKDLTVCVKERDDTEYWSYSRYGNSPTPMAIISIVAFITFGLFGVLFLPGAIGELLEWIIIPEFQYLEMLKGMMN